MNVLRLPLEADLSRRFPVREPLLPGSDTGTIFQASSDGKFYVVLDERARADLAHAPDHRDTPRGLLDNLVTVLEFGTEAERAAHVADVEKAIADARRRKDEQPPHNP